MNIALLLKHEVGGLNTTNIGGTEAIFLEDIRLFREQKIQVNAYARFTNTTRGIVKLPVLPWLVPIATRLYGIRRFVEILSELYYTYSFVRKTRNAVRMGYSTPLLPLFAPKSVVLFENAHHNFFLPQILSFIYRQGTYIFCSEYLKKEYRKRYSFLNKKNTCVIYNAIDTRVFKSSGSHPTLHAPIKLLFCGAWAPEKGLDILLKALIMFQNNFPPAFSLTVSSNSKMWYSDYPSDQSPYIHGVYQLVKQLKNVRLLGGAKRTRMPHLYQTHDFTIVPSVWGEPFGLVALESIACGTPVIAFRRGGLPEILSKQNAFILSPGKKSLMRLLIAISRGSTTLHKPVSLTSKNFPMLQSYRIKQLTQLFDRQ